MSTMVETLTERKMLEGKKFEEQEGYGYPVAEFDDEVARDLMAGEKYKIGRGIPPSFRRAVPIQPGTVKVDDDTRVQPRIPVKIGKKRGRQPKKLVNNDRSKSD